ncbi:MAG: DUF5074 domain-containing protein [Parabacteroides sp.]
MMKSKLVYGAALAVCFLFPFVGCSDDEELVDPVPTVQVSNLQFADENPAQGLLSGTLTWTAPSSLENVTAYRICISSSVNGSQFTLAEVPVGTNSYTLTDVDYMGYLSVFACNGVNAAATGASIAVSDLFIDESVHAIYILNSGKFGSNNASLTKLNIQGDQLVEQDYFKTQNGRGLGDTAQDILAYGEKMYIAMYGESTIEITDLQAKSIKQVKTEGQPRALVAEEGKIYISYYNGYVARLDTASLEVEATVKVGRNPEQMAIYNQKLYVANSGGMDYNTEAGYDKTVSVVDLASFTETKNIDVVLNPCNLQSVEDGIYLISMGNYADVPNTLQWIDPNTDEASVVEALPNATEMAYLEGKLFTDYSQYDANWNQVITFSTLDLKTQAVTTWDPQIAKPYKMCATEANLVIMESDYTNNGNAYFFDSTGYNLKEIETGLNPIKAILVEKD